MRYTAWLVVLAGAVLAGRLALAADKAEVVVDLDGLKSKAPKEWKEEPPANKMRYMQFRLPKATGDKEDAELQIFKNAGGSVKDNIKRWQGQFTPPAGKDIDDVSKVTEIKIGGKTATMLDIHGTYLFKTRPFDPKDKGEKRENYRMLAIQFNGPENLYHIKLIGPAKTIEQYQKGFDEWLKNFK
jgi:hypothetical protein